MAQLRIALLGSFQVTLDGKVDVTFETDPARALLAYLVMNAGTRFRRDVLATLLWPEEPRADGLHALRQTLSRVRRAIQDKQAEPAFLEITRQTIRFNPESTYWLDLDAFSQLAATIHQHPHRKLEACATCMQQVTQAADLYRGDLLTGLTLNSLPFQEWLVMERETLHRRAMEIFYYLATCHNRHASYQQAQRYARRQLELEPWREEAHRQLMRTLAASGQRSAALSQYEACCQILQAELHVASEEKTIRLYEQIRDGEFATASPLHNLPAPLTRFVGREDELDQITTLLNDPHLRLLTLVGPGGVGKTRLALAAAKRMAPHFANGAWFVPLMEVGQDSQEHLRNTLAVAIGAAIGIPFSGQETPQAQLLAYLRRQDTLLILDGFEHVLPGVEMVLEMLAQAPHLVVLVTSRTRLDVQAEQAVPVDGLLVPQDDDPDPTKYSSVQLFLDRSKCPPSGDGEDLAQIARLCRLVAGTPLAIELASAWAEHLPLGEIIARLERDIASLPTTRRDLSLIHI